MLSVTQSAKLLGVSTSRVRALIKTGMLPAVKVGTSWCLEEIDVLRRIANQPKAGRPSYSEDIWNGKDVVESSSNIESEARHERAIKAHELYQSCKEIFSQYPNDEMFSASSSNEEISFYMATLDFFLQQKQKELVQAGVY